MIQLVLARGGGGGGGVEGECMNGLLHHVKATI